MIIEEILQDNPDLVRRYSDRGVYIHGGNPEGNYSEAIDLVSSGNTYVETNIPIIEEGNIADDDAREALRILINV